MATITALKAQKRNAERINIHLDGTYAFSLALSAATGLTVGQMLTADEIATLKRLDDQEKAKQAAMRLLSYRPRSVAEVERHLRRKGYAEAAIATAVARLQELDFLDDNVFAAYWIEQRNTFKPRGHIALQYELQSKGVSRDVIAAALTQVDEGDAARRAAQQRARRWRHLSEADFRKKLGRFLQRRGFDYATIQEVTNHTWQLIESDQLP